MPTKGERCRCAIPVLDGVTIDPLTEATIALSGMCRAATDVWCRQVHGLSLSAILDQPMATCCTSTRRQQHDHA